MTVARRRLGPDGPLLSQICYGSMRLGVIDEAGRRADHLCQLHDLGIDTHHSSHEYDSHSIYLTALGKARATGRRFRHIVKLADPGFDHDRFDPVRLGRLFDRSRAELGVDTIDSVQWLFRTPDPNDDLRRIATVTEQAEEVKAWATTQMENGTLRNLSFFPYSLPFADTIMRQEISATPATYLNMAERESITLLDRSHGFIALRPLAGGRLVGDPVVPDELVDDRVASVFSSLSPADRALTALRFPLLHPSVTTTVVSVNSPGHIDQVMEVATTQPDIAAFVDLVDSVVDSGVGSSSDGDPQDDPIIATEL